MAQAKRKQKFFDVEIPILNKETQLYGYDIKELVGRTITYDLTRLLRGKSMIIKLKVVAEGDKVFATPKQLIVLPYFIRRMMRKGVNYVEDSFSTECKDALIKIKIFLITRKKVSRAVRKALREKARKELQDYIKTKDKETLFDEIIKSKIQKLLSQKLKKIYPLSLCEIRVFGIEKDISQKEPIEK
ncbi:MAG: hypothetical protein ABIH65_03885 [Nanoarchaeota archaeon]